MKIVGIVVGAGSRPPRVLGGVSTIPLRKGKMLARRPPVGEFHRRSTFVTLRYASRADGRGRSQSLWRRSDNNIGKATRVCPAPTRRCYSTAAPSPNPSHSTKKLFGEPSAQIRTVPVTIILIACGLYLLNEYTDWYDDPDWPPPMALVPSFRAASEREGATP